MHGTEWQGDDIAGCRGARLQVCGLRIPLRANERVDP